VQQNRWPRHGHTVTGQVGVLPELGLGRLQRPRQMMDRLKYYLGRAQVTNDMHGLGAFIIMFEQLNK
jgi:hypothetical protein